MKNIFDQDGFEKVVSDDVYEALSFELECTKVYGKQMQALLLIETIEKMLATEVGTPERERVKADFVRQFSQEKRFLPFTRR